MTSERFENGAEKTQNPLRSHGTGSKFNFNQSDLKTIPKWCEMSMVPLGAPGFCSFSKKRQTKNNGELK